MDISVFRRSVWTEFGGSARNRPDADPASPVHFDTCPEIEGKLSPRKQRLLNLAYGLLPPDEAYLEVGTYHGKSLISAMLGNAHRPTYACDNFSEFDVNSFDITMGHIERCGLRDRVVFYDQDFRGIYTPEKLPHRIGVYFYDGAHDYQSQEDAITLVEPFLADEALVIVDDWRFAPDSGSYARAATLRAAEQSAHRWRLLYELPARYNGDLALWWNGVGVLSFQRKGIGLPEARPTD